MSYLMNATFSEADRPPQFNQGRYISIRGRNIENSRFQNHAQNQPFLVKKWLKRLRIRKNVISWKCDFVRNWLTPHFNKTRGISLVDWNIKDFTWSSPSKSAILRQERKKRLTLAENEEKWHTDWPIFFNRIKLFPPSIEISNTLDQSLTCKINYL